MKVFLFINLLCLSFSTLACNLRTVDGFIDALKSPSEILELRKNQKFQSACHKALEDKECLMKNAGGDFMEISHVGAVLSLCENNLTNNLNTN